MQNTVAAVYRISGGERFLLIAIPILSVLSLLLVAGYTIYHSFQTQRHRKNTLSPPLQHVQATLSSKHLSPSPSANPLCFATFTTQDGHTLAFSIPQREYPSLSEGESGLLHYQGTLFVRFDTTPSC